MALTAEGYLIVHDRMMPGRAMDGWNGGTLWQLYEKQAAGHDWFCAADDGAYPASDGAASVPPQRMLVRFDTSDRAQTGVEEIKQEYHSPIRTAASQAISARRLSAGSGTAGQPAAFTFGGAAPRSMEGTPEDMARRSGGVRPQRFRGGDGGGVRGHPDVKVVLHGDEWSVRRATATATAQPGFKPESADRIDGQRIRTSKSPPGGKPHE